MDPKLLYEAPFTDFDRNGVEGVFEKPDVVRLVKSCETLNRNLRLKFPTSCAASSTVALRGTTAGFAPALRSHLHVQDFLFFFAAGEMRGGPLQQQPVRGP